MQIKGALGSHHRARSRHCTQQAGGGYRVTAEEDVIAPFDGRPISPRGTGIVEGTRTTVEELPSSPGLAIPLPGTGLLRRFIQHEVDSDFSHLKR